ncbi:MAG: AraC family transcriptional regulator [Hyphomonas sp.]|nr:AraC family transcriptional regulator [Hyphomonas sp.]
MSRLAPEHFQRYLARIEHVRDHMRANLDEPLDLDTLAEVACLSRFHWHRVYRAMTGETAAQTVRRLRLSRAADELAQTSRPIAQIAERAGYATPAAFSRAFASAHGVPPAEFRAGGMHAVLSQAIQEENALAFPIDIRTLPRRPAIGLVHEGPYVEIGRTFERLFSELEAAGLIGHARGPFGLYIDDPDAVPAEDLRSHACTFTDVALKPPAPLEPVEAGGGTYAVLTYKGPYSAMKPAYDWLFGTWLPASGREARDEPVLEINLNTPMDVAPSELLTEICLPLED